jgi:hypothetical protein
MPHFDEQGREQWVCQKGGHICTGKSTWVEVGSELAKKLGFRGGNICDRCLNAADENRTISHDHPRNCTCDLCTDRPMDLIEYASRESGHPIGSPALRAYVNRYYGHG